MGTYITPCSTIFLPVPRIHSGLAAPYRRQGKLPFQPRRAMGHVHYSVLHYHLHSVRPEDNVLIKAPLSTRHTPSVVSVPYTGTTTQIVYQRSEPSAVAPSSWHLRLGYEYHHRPVLLSGPCAHCAI